VSGFLGYDPGRVLMLRRALAAAIAEATSVRCGEAEAGDASERWRRAIGVMTPWEPRLAAIVSCAFDTPYRPVTIRDPVPLDHACEAAQRPRSALQLPGLHDRIHPSSLRRAVLPPDGMCA